MHVPCGHPNKKMRLHTSNWLAMLWKTNTHYLFPFIRASIEYQLVNFNFLKNFEDELNALLVSGVQYNDLIFLYQ